VVSSDRPDNEYPYSPFGIPLTLAHQRRHTLGRDGSRSAHRITGPRFGFMIITNFMAKSFRDNQKKDRRGRPKTTGTTPMTGVRLSSELETAVIDWAKRQADKPSKAEAIRRLVELGLAGEPREARRQKARRKASAMAGEQIDRLLGNQAASEEGKRRKRRLLKGPKEFRGLKAGTHK
jgi:hypothetical protein